MTDQMLTQVQIAGNNLSPGTIIKRWERDKEHNKSIDEITITASRNITADVTLDANQTVEVWRGWTTTTDEKIFSGNIEHHTIQGAVITIKAKGKLWQAVRKEVNKSYDANVDPSAGKGSEIWKNLMSGFAGFTADQLSATDTGTINTITRFVCRRTDVFERAQEVADYYNYQQYFDPEADKAIFEPVGNTLNSNVITIDNNQTAVMEIPKWKLGDVKEMINKVTVIGASQIVVAKEQYTGDGTTTAFDLNSGIPVWIQVDLENARQKGGLTSATTDPDYTVDKEAQTFTFSTGPPNNDIVDVEYGYAIPTPVIRKNQASIDTYEEWTRSFTFTDIKNVADAEFKGDQILKIRGLPFVSTTLKVRNPRNLGLKAGQKIRVNDKINNVDKEVLITKHKMRYPSRFDEIFVGDREWRLAQFETEVLKRLRRIEELEFENQDILLNVEDLEHAINFVRDNISVSTRPINNIWYLDHPVNGVLDSGKLLDDFETVTSWNNSGGTDAIAADTDSGFAIGGGNAFKGNISASQSGTDVAIWSSTATHSNMSAYSGSATGTATQGTVDFYVGTDNVAAVNNLSIKIGSSSSDYVAFNVSSSDLVENKMVYAAKNLPSASYTGTIDWAALDYKEIRVNTATGNTSDFNVYVDILTIGDSSVIGMPVLADVRGLYGKGEYVNQIDQSYN